MATMICLACDWCSVRSVHAECSSGSVARKAIMASGEWQTLDSQDLCPDCVSLYERENEDE
jgi:rubredoxin